MAANRGLGKRLSREFFLQAIYISVAALFGVFAVAVLLQDVLTKQALRTEADYYWQRYAEDPAMPLPETRNMIGYRDNSVRPPPADLADLPTGFHRQRNGDSQVALVTEHDGTRLYLVFKARQVNELVFVFGLLPLVVVLIVIYLSLYAAYRVSQRAVSPFIALAEQVQKLDPGQPDPSLFEAESGQDGEIELLCNALQNLAKRLDSFAERERNFTRDASHELRSPLTVIRMATDVVAADASLSDAAQTHVQRIRQAAKDMEELTEAFLLLARESVAQLRDEWVSVNDVVIGETERTRLLIGAKPVQISNAADNHLFVAAPEKVIASIIGNLTRNGLLYTDEGEVNVRIQDRRVTVSDTGPGMEPEEVEQMFQPFFRGDPSRRRRGGHGVGLTIVKRLADRFGWPLSVKSERGRGTEVTIEFPDAKFEAISPPLHG
ncbi:MAG: HAMP domain-containing sensor histidine kinase [Pseudomonadota bacterium]